MAQRQRWWTTVTDIEEYKKTTWSFLKNIKMTWEYDGMAYLFREAGIPVAGIDRGTLKMNHPIMAMGVPIQRDKNYGVDIYVPQGMKGRAVALLCDEDHVRECAQLEAEIAGEQAELFKEAVLESKARNATARKNHRKVFLTSLFAGRTAGS